MFELDGKVAIVTGAGRGVGRSEALFLASLGAMVVVNDLGSEGTGTGQDISPADAVVEEIRSAGGRAIANYDDVADWEGGQRMISQAIETFGGLDILICNAGILRDRMMFNMSEEEWDGVIRVHLKGHFVPTRFAAEYWRAQFKATGSPVGARILFTSSEAGLYGNAGQCNYVGAKGGIATMGLAAARELERLGVEVNTICPRARTRLSAHLLEGVVTPDGPDIWHPDNVAALAAFLCSPAANGISGQVFAVGAGCIELIENWRAVDQVSRPGALWTLSSVGDAVAKIFDGRSSQPAPMVAPGESPARPCAGERSR